MARTKKRGGRFPSIAELTRLCASVKKEIDDEFRVSDDPDDDRPGILLTVGVSDDGSWDYQTGDTQYHGGAYGHPHWGSVGIYRDTKCGEAAREILDEIKDAYSMSRA